jgi:hypothetical protein
MSGWATILARKVRELKMALETTKREERSKEDPYCRYGRALVSTGELTVSTIDDMVGGSKGDACQAFWIQTRSKHLLLFPKRMLFSQICFVAISFSFSLENLLGSTYNIYPRHINRAYSGDLTVGR